MSALDGAGQEHWSQKKEASRKGRGMRFLSWLVRWVPFPLLVLLAFPVSFLYFLCARQARNAAVEYQRHVVCFCAGEGIPEEADGADEPVARLRRAHPWLQFLSFAVCLIEKVACWSGKASLENVIFHQDGVVPLKERLAQGKGALIITSHLGNVELFRCLASRGQTGVERDIPVTAIMDTGVTPQFSATMQALNPRFTFDMIGSASIGLDTIERLQERITGGGLVVIAGDRTSAHSPERSIPGRFLGEETDFPFGAFFLASLLEAPVYFLFCVRKRHTLFLPRYHMHVTEAGTASGGTRSERRRKTAELCGAFVRELEGWCARYPYQWYNFYSFWKGGKA